MFPLTFNFILKVHTKIKKKSMKSKYSYSYNIEIKITVLKITRSKPFIYALVHDNVGILESQSKSTPRVLSPFRGGGLCTSMTG